MSDWTADELDTIGNANEIQLSTARDDGSLRAFVPVWIFRVGDSLYLRSYRGPGGSWYRHARVHPQGHLRIGEIDRDIKFTDPGDIATATVDEAYRDKYGKSVYVNTMVRDDVATTTLRVVPD